MTRVTNAMLSRTTLADVTARRLSLARIQEQAASGLRINRPSDDPVGVRTATVLRSEIQAASQLARNQDQATERLVATETGLTRAQAITARARELAIAGSNDALGADGRLALSSEVEELYGEMVAAANARASGGYVFGGYASDTAPIAVAGDFSAGVPPVASFVGDASEVEVEIEPGIRVPVTRNGERVFLGDGDGDGLTDAGRADVFALLGELWQGLRNNDADGVRATLDGFDRGQVQLSVERTRVGASSARVGAARTAVVDRQFHDRERLSQIEDADTIAIFSELTTQEASLQASLSAMARLIQPSLLNFLA